MPYKVPPAWSDCALFGAISHAIALDFHIVACATSHGESQVATSDQVFGTHTLDC
jgi:hypothetical protein